MNPVGTDSTPSLTLLSDRRSNSRDAVERVLTRSWVMCMVLRSRQLPMSAFLGFLFLGMMLIGEALAADPSSPRGVSVAAATNNLSSAWFADRGQSLHERELTWIHWLQQTKALAWPMRIITNLGPSVYVIAFLPFVFLCLDPRIGIRLALVYFVSSALREALALAFCFPRPFWIDAAVDTFHYRRALTFSYSFPSGHALIGTSIWLFAASRFRRPWAWCVGIAMALLICFSRVYLGVHFPSDVTAGFVAGAMFVALVIGLEALLGTWWQAAGLRRQCVAAAVLSGMLILAGILAKSLHSAMPDPPLWAAFAVKAREVHRITEQAGAVFGLAVGWAIGRRWAPFEVFGPWWQRLACWVLGCAPLAVIYGTRWLGPADSEVIRAAVRFCGASLATGLLMGVVPWLCLRWKLVRPEVAR